MVMAMMSVLVVILIIRAARRVVIWVSTFMMIMIMGMKARGGHVLLHVLLHVPMQPRRRRPGELERDDEHDDQGDEATHGVHSTEITVSTKGSFIPSTRLWADTRLARSTGTCRADGCKSSCYPLRNGRTVIKT